MDYVKEFRNNTKTIPFERAYREKRKITMPIEKKIKQFLEELKELPHFNKGSSKRGMKSLRKFKEMVARAILAWELQKNLPIGEKNHE